MHEPVPAGTWVELHRVVLEPGGRAPQVPPETRQVPLELRVRGWLTAAAVPGEEAEIRTPAGRLVRGQLDVVAPANLHTFGPPVPELAVVGDELRRLLRDDGGRP